jgi:hypothetical protein
VAIWTSKSNEILNWIIPYNFSQSLELRAWGVSYGRMADINKEIANIERILNTGVESVRLTAFRLDSTSKRFDADCAASTGKEIRGARRSRAGLMAALAKINNHAHRLQEIPSKNSNYFCTMWCNLVPPLLQKICISTNLLYSQQLFK